ncbi:hypothetical protein PFISCL1PPCAC_19251, partial [Pristionchus fissidentatus]
IQVPTMTSSSSLLVFCTLFILCVLSSAWPTESRLSPEERQLLREVLAERDFVMTNPVKARRSPSMEGFDFTSALRSIDNIQKPRFGRRR